MQIIYLKVAHENYRTEKFRNKTLTEWTQQQSGDDTVKNQ